MGEPTNGGCDDAQNARPRDSNKVKARERGAKWATAEKFFTLFQRVAESSGAREWYSTWTACISQPRISLAQGTPI